jgi:hypothetical protein
MILKWYPMCHCAMLLSRLQSAHLSVTEGTTRLRLGAIILSGTCTIWLAQPLSLPLLLLLLLRWLLRLLMAHVHTRTLTCVPTHASFEIITVILFGCIL